MEDNTFFYGVIAALFVVFTCVILYKEKKFPAKKPIKKPELITHSLTSRYFMIITFMAMLPAAMLLFDLYWLMLVWMVLIFAFSYFKSFEKVNKNALDEREKQRSLI